jgi:formylglycine-generating enzyme required for sulfatase activity
VKLSSLASFAGALLAAAFLAAARPSHVVRADDAQGDLPPGVRREGARFFSTTDGEELAFVPSGAFTMGTRARTDDVEAMPDHEETTGAFYIEIHEVTNARYARFLAAIAEKGHATCPKDEPANKDHRPLDWGTEAYKDRSPGDDYPVCGVDWYDARAYAAWAGKRLPTEAEWEKAARGTDERPLPWGDSWPKSKGATGIASPDDQGIFRANWRDDADGYLFAAPVGKFPQGASPYGCLDMAGNAWEWTDSEFTLYPGHYPYLEKKYPEADRKSWRIYRGGSFNFSTMDLQTTHRHWGPPTKKELDMGLRCVISAKKP